MKRSETDLARCIDCKYHRRTGIIERLREGAGFRKEKYFICSYKKTRIEIEGLRIERKCEFFELFAKFAVWVHAFSRFKSRGRWGPPR